MAPVKRSKSVNKGFAAVTDTSPSKDEKSKQKKRKLSDMLGSQWSKHELERFYEAYRKYGQDWKKVASFVRSRSIEMVEAIYNMNRAYLSLPEGTASVVGLIAMMTDHYNVMAANGIERESDERVVITKKLQKYPKVKVQGDPPTEDTFQRQSIGSSDRCLSSLKIHLDGIQPHFPVRKRTPRVPVSVLDTHPSKKLRGSIMNLNNDEVSCGGLFLTEAQQTPSSLHVSQATYRETERIKPSYSAMERGPTYRGNAVNEESADGSLGSNEAKHGNLVRDSVDSGTYASSEFKTKRKKGKKEEVVLAEAKVFNGIREAYNFTDRGQRGILDPDGASPKTHRSSSDIQKKRNKKLMFEDEHAACDALQTLAELSLMMPYLAGDSVELAGESVGKDTMAGRNGHTDVELKNEGDQECKKTNKSETLMTLAGEEVKSPHSSGHLSTISRRCTSSVRSPSISSSSNHSIGQVEVAVSSTQALNVSQVVCTSRRKSCRKRDRTLFQKDRNYALSTCSSDCNSAVRDKVKCLKEKISHCLSWHDVRRWCVYEWFYSAIDYPWFAKREFVEYLDHVGLGHIPRLTRVEWGVIRSSLGKPRRFSERFLQEERDKLKQYRESVRTHYANLRAGFGEGLPTDLARPLSVGQEVVAIHPKTREFYNGSILTVDRHSCLVQFDHPDLGVELVMDIDCMPSNPVENMPENLRKQKMFDSRCSQEANVNGASILVSNEHMKNMNFHFCATSSNPFVTNETKVWPAFNSLPTITGSGSLMTSSATQSQCSYMAPMQPRKDDTRSIVGPTQTIDRKVHEQNIRHPGNPSCWPQSVVNSVGLNGTIHSSNNSTFSCQETASNVAEIVEGSRNKALRMVDIAIKVISEMKEGEDAFRRIGRALDAPNKAEYATRVSMVTPSNTTQGLPYQDPVTSGISETQLAGDASGMKSVTGSDLQIPSNLITSCVASLLMIQTCTERQYPPAEVAQILDNAVTNMHPRCSRNLSIYREIRMCMGRIKTQILALVPT